MKLKSRIAHISEIYRPFYRVFAVILFIIICTQVLGMMLPFFYGKIIDGFIKVKPVDGLVKLAVIMLAILFLRNILDMIHGRIHVGKVSFAVEKRISGVTLNRVMSLSLGQILNQNSGFKVDVIKKGESSLMEMVELLIFEMIPIIIRITITTVGLFVLNAYLGVITIVSVLAFITSSFIINRAMMPKLREQTKAGNKLGTAYWEIIRHLRLVIVNNQEKRAVREYGAEFEGYSDKGKQLWFSYFTKVTCLREPFVSLGQFAVLLAGIHLVHSGKATPGTLLMAMSWSMFAFQAVGNVGSLQRRIARYSVLISRYFELLEIPPAVTVVQDPISPDKFLGRIEFRNVSFNYPRFDGSNGGLAGAGKTKPDSGDDSQAIKNVSFTIEPGTTVALVGHSGAGKSTVINLLLRGYDPHEGQILVDGHDLRQVDLGAWRRAVGCVEQEPKLWDQTLRYNMTYGLNGHAPDVTDEALHELAGKARINEFYSRLGEKPFDTVIGENGVMLSGGQRQRVAIARAIAKSPSVVILDEATNALDPVNEALIHQAIRNALVGRTGIIIAHRLSTIRHADQIIVFEKGCVVGNGTHDELMQNCTAYQALVEREAGGFST